MSKIAPVIVAASLLVALAAIVIFTARGCGQPPPLPPTATATIAATTPPKATISPSATFYAPTAAVTPVATRTPVLTAAATISAMETVAPSPTATVAVTAELLGHHRVGRGETMYGIGLEWYRGRYLAWGADVWRPICDANPQIVDCRLIYPGDVLGVPRLP